MSEFETATIALEHASLWAMYAQAGIAGLVGLVQCTLIAWGLRLMQRSGADRTAQNQALFDKMGQQHEENMLALRTLIERTAQR